MSSKSLGTLTLDLVARVGGFEKGMDKAARTSKKRMDSIKKQAKQMGKAIAVAGTAAAAGLAVIVKEFAATADQTAKFSQSIGISTEALSQLDYAAQLSGSNMDELSKGLLRLSRNAGDADKGLATASEAFEVLGISITDAEGKLKSADELLLDVADSFSGIEDTTKKAALAQELFGRSGAKLIPLLNQGRDGIKAMTDEADSLGLTLSSDAAKAAENFNDNMLRVSASAKAFKIQMSSALIPTLGDLAGAFVETNKETAVAEELGQSLGSAIKGVAAAAVGAVASVKLLGKTIGGLLAAAEAGFEDAAWYEKIVPVFAARRVAKNWDGVKSTLDVVGDDLAANIEEYATLLDNIWASGEGDSGASDRVGQIREQYDAISTGLKQTAKEIRDQAKAESDAMDDLISSAYAESSAISGAKKASKDALDSVRQSLMTEEELINQSYERRLQMVLENTREGSDQRLELEKKLTQQRNQQIAELEAAQASLILSTSSELFGNLAGLAEAFGDKQSSTYKALFAVSKAFAIADAGLRLGMALGQAFADPSALTLPQKLANYAAVAGAMGQVLSSIQGVNFAGAFDNGGNIPAGSFGIVGEIGPEIVQGPAHVTSRRDTAKMMGGGDVVVNLHEDASRAGRVDQREDNGQRMIDVFVSNIRSDGAAARAIQSTYGVQRRGS